MTPSEMIDIVKSELVPVCYLDDGQLEALMKKALLTLHESVGMVKTVKVPDDGVYIAVPSDFSDISTGHDSRKRWVNVERATIEDADGNPLDVLQVIPAVPSIAPYFITYFVDLAGIDLVSGEIPNGMTSLVWDYFRAMAEMPNTIRARSVARATGRNDEFRGDSELDEAIKAAKEAMKDAASMSLPVVVGV